MKKQDSLDDLIISDNLGSKKSNDSKNMLTMIGLVLAVLIGAILLTKTVLEEPQKPKIPLEENLTNSALVQADMNESNASDINESMMLESNTSTPANEDINTSVSEKVSTPKTTVAPVVVAKKIVEKTVTKEAVKKPLPVKEKVDTKTEVKTEKKDVNKTTTAKTEVKTETKTKTVTENIKKEQATNETYYAQVGSFSTKPNDGFISIIKSNGYSYKVVTGQNGSSKILIGPYSGREKATIALVKIKDRINKSAFLVKQ